jgi:hypothetical protein
MAVAASVKTVITVKGNDQASRQIKKSTTAMGRLSSSMTAATAKSQALGASLRNMATGNISGALSSVGGLLGGPGGAGGIAAAAGAATAATAALGVAVGVAAFKFTEWSSEIERSRAALDNTFGGQGVEKAIGFARQIGGVGVESVQKLATTLKASGINATVTAEQMQELANRATQMGKSGDEALTAFAEAVQKGTTRSLAQVGVFVSMTKAQEDFLKGTGRSTQSMSQAEKQAAVLAAVMRDLTNTAGATSSVYSRQDDVLARLSIAWSELKFVVSGYLAGPASGILENIASFIEIGGQLARVTLAAWNVGFTTVLMPVRALGVALGTVFNVSKALASGGLRKAGVALKESFGGAVGFTYGKTATAFSDLATEIGKVGDSTRKTVKEIQFAGSAFASLEGAAAKFSQGIAKRAKLEADLARKRAENARKAAKAAAKARAFRRLRIDSTRKMIDLENAARQAQAAGKPMQLARLKVLKSELDMNRKIEKVLKNRSLNEAEKQRTITAIRKIALLEQVGHIKKGKDAVVAAEKAKSDARDKAFKKEAAARDARRSAQANMIATENQLAQIKAANNPAELARLQNLQTEVELQQKIAIIKQNRNLSEAEQQRMIDATRGIAHAKQMKRIDEATKAENRASAARINGMIAVGQASMGLLEAVGVNGRAIAAFQAGLAAAQAFLAFSVGDYVGMIAATTAAINFGKIAGSSPETPSSSGAASSAPALTSPGITQPSSGTGGGGASYNITINGVYATAAETGAAIKQALGAAAATGMQGT